VYKFGRPAPRHDINEIRLPLFAALKITLNSQCKRRDADAALSGAEFGFPGEAPH
jgi:hypothetical protein